MAQGEGEEQTPTLPGKEKTRMLLKINRTNLNGEELEAVINTDLIGVIKDRGAKKVSLYDEDGNLVEEREGDKVYEIVLKGVGRLFVKEDGYKAILKALSVE